MLPFTIWDLGLRGLLAERGRGGKLLNGSRDDSFLPTVEPPGEEGDDWLELCPESEFAACWQVVSVSFLSFLFFPPAGLHGGFWGRCGVRDQDPGLEPTQPTWRSTIGNFDGALIGLCQCRGRETRNQRCKGSIFQTCYIPVFVKIFLAYKDFR